MNKNFAETFGLSYFTGTFKREQEIEISFENVASRCEMDLLACKAGYSRLIHAIGDAMKSHDHVDIDIGLGYIQSENSQVCHMIQQRVKESWLSSPTKPKEAKPHRKTSPRKSAKTPGLARLPRTSHNLKFKAPVMQEPSRLGVSDEQHMIYTNYFAECLRDEIRKRETCSNAQESNYPPLLDKNTRTIAAEVSGSSNAINISNRIGSNCCPASASLVMGGKNGIKFMEHGKISYSQTAISPLSASKVCLEHDADDLIISNDLERYEYYWKNGIENQAVAEMDPKWTNGVIKRLPKKTDVEQKQLLKGIMAEVIQDYFSSVKKSILDYMLLGHSTQQRLLIKGTPESYRLFPKSTSSVVGDAEYFLSFRAQISAELMVVDTHIQALHGLWADFDKLLLVDIPSMQDSKQPPPTLAEFEAMQTKQNESVTTFLVNNWYVAARRIISSSTKKDLIPAAIAHPKKFFDCIAAVMSVALRGLVSRSIQALVNFFEHFAMDKVKKPSLAGFLIPLVFKNGRIGIQNTFEELESTILEILYNTATKLNDVDRLERTLEPALKVSESKHLWNFKQDEGEVVVAATRIQKILRENMDHVLKLESYYTKFRFLATVDNDVDHFISEDQNLHAYDQQISKYYAVARDIYLSTKDKVHLNLFEVNCSNVNDMIISKTNQVAQRILGRFAESISRLNADIKTRYKKIAGKLNKPPSDLHELVQAEEYVLALHQTELGELGECLEEIKEGVKYLMAHARQLTFEPVQQPFCIPSDLLISSAQTVAWGKRISSVLKGGEASLANERYRIENEFVLRRSRFKAQLETIDDEVRMFQKKGDFRMTSTYVSQLDVIRESLDEARRTVEVIGDEELKLGWEQTDFTHLDEICSRLEPYMKLWNSTCDFREAHSRWHRGNIFELDVKEVERDVDSMLASITKAMKDLRDVAPAALSVGEHIKKELLSFRSYIGVIRAFVNENLRERHWNKIAEVVGFPINPEEHFTLQRLLELGIESSLTVLEQINEAATEENRIELSLTQMQREWISVEFKFHGLRGGCTLTLLQSSLEQSFHILSSQLTEVQAIQRSIHCRPFFSTAVEWEKTLSGVEITLRDLSLMNKSWMYLEPIFGCVEIRQRIPVESKKFDKINQNWIGLISTIVARPLCIEVGKIPNIQNILDESRALMDEVLLGINKCLASQREDFPRLYFLSNSDMVAILSGGVQTLNAQQHLIRCFGGVYQVVLDSQEDIVGIRSIDHEIVTFKEIISTKDSSPIKWMKTLEKSIHTIMRSITRTCFEQTPVDGDLVKDTKDWPQQLFILTRHIRWTQAIENAIKSDSSGTFEDIKKRLSDETEAIVQALDSMALSQQQFLTLERIVLENIYHQEITVQTQDVSALDQFEWISQLRSYRRDESVYFELMTSAMEYGFEYTGTSHDRLIMNPLTLRCFQSLIVAASEPYATVVSGRSGVGKSATIHSLAHTMAKFFYNEICHANSSIEQVTQVLNGTLRIGGWVCFDNMDQLPTNVLALVAQLCFTIAESVLNSTRIVSLDGKKVSVATGTTIFATAGLGFTSAYKGSFRRVTLLPPSTKELVYILLQSHGFGEPEALSRTSCVVVDLCESYGLLRYDGHKLRLMKEIASEVSALRHRNHTDNLKTLLAKGCWNVLSRQVPDSHDVLVDILNTAFPQNLDVCVSLEKFNDSIQQICENAQLVPKQELLDKVQDLYACICSRTGVLIHGAAATGKSTLYTVLASTLSDYHDRKAHPTLDDSYECLTEFRVINPHAIPLSEIYGAPNDGTSFNDGILGQILKSIAHEKKQHHKRFWIIFDGFISDSWCEILNSSLDQIHGHVTLLTGERIYMPLGVNFIFETGDLQHVSPSTIARCAVVHTSATLVQHEMLITLWMNNIPEIVSTIEGVRSIFKQLFCFIEPCLKFIRKNRWNSYSPISRVDNMLHLLTICIAETFPETTGFTSKQIVIVLECLVLHSLVWGVGYSADAEERKKFDLFLRGLIETAVSTGIATRSFNLTYPTYGTVYDFMLSLEWGIKWEVGLDYYLSKNPSSGANTCSDMSMFVPTPCTSMCSVLMEQLSAKSTDILLLGDRDAGKSSVAENSLKTILRAESHRVVNFPLKSRTSPLTLSQTLANGLIRHSFTCIGPEPGKRGVLFVDDINCSSSSCAEFLRHMMDKKEMYDLKKHENCTIKDVGVIATSSQVKKSISERLIHHFFPIGLLPADASDLDLIFAPYFNPIIQPELSQSLVYSTALLYTLCRDRFQSSMLFCQKDIQRVLDGMCTKGDISEKAKYLRYWIYQVSRNFGDKLNTERDLEWFYIRIQEIFTEVFEVRPEAVFQVGAADLLDRLRDVKFSVDLKTGLVREVNGSYDKTLTISTDLVLRGALTDQVVRLCGIFYSNHPHIYLWGRENTGKETLATQALNLCQFPMIKIVIHEEYTLKQWNDDVASVIKRIATSKNNQPTALVVRDQTGRFPVIYEDLETLIDTGKFDKTSASLALRVVKLLRVVVINTSETPRFLKQCTIFSFEPWTVRIFDDIASGENSKAFRLMYMYMKEMNPVEFLHHLSLFEEMYPKVSKRLALEQQLYQNVLIKLQETQTAFEESQKAVKNQDGNNITESPDDGAQLERERFELELDEKRLAQDKKNLISFRESIRTRRSDCDFSIKAAVDGVSTSLSALDIVSNVALIEMYEKKPVHPHIQRLIESIGMLFRVFPIERPSSDAKGSHVLDYFEPTKEILADPDFIDDLREYDAGVMPESVLSQLLTHMGTNSFTTEDLLDYSSTAALLNDFITATMKHATVMRETRPILTILQDDLVTLEKQEEEIVERKGAIEDRKAAWKTRMDVFEAEGRARERMAQEAQHHLNVLEGAGELVERLEPLIKTVKSTLKTILLRQNSIVGDVMLATAQIAYVSHRLPYEREGVVLKWKEILTESHILYSETRIWQVLNSRKDNLDWTATGLSIEYFTEATMIWHSKRTPIIWDPENLFLPWLKSRYQNVIEIEETDPTLKNVLASKASNTIVLIEVCTGREVVFAAQDGVYLVSSKLKIEDHPRRTTTIIRIPMTKKAIERAVISISSSHLENQCLSTQIAYAQAVVDDENTMLDCLNSISTSKTALHSDGENVETLTLLNTAWEESSRVLASMVAEIEVNQVKIQEHQPLISMVEAIYFALQDISMVNRFYYFPLRWVMSILAEAKGNATLFIQQSLRLINAATRVKDQLLVHTLIALRMDRCFDISLLEFLSTPSRPTERLDTCPEWLDSDAWTRICQLSLVSSAGLPESFRGDMAKVWKQVLETQDIVDFKFPIEISRLERLCLIKILRPDALSLEMTHFVEEIFAPYKVIINEYAELDEIYELSSNTTPLTVIPEPGEDITPSIAALARKYHQVTRVNNKNIDRMMKVGEWAIRSPFIPDKSSQLSTDCHSNYRLWTTFDSISSVPEQLIKKGLKIVQKPPMTAPSDEYELLYRFHMAVIEQQWSHEYSFTRNELQRSIEILRNEEWSEKMKQNLIIDKVYGNAIASDRDYALLQSVAAVYNLKTDVEDEPVPLKRFDEHILKCLRWISNKTELSVGELTKLKLLRDEFISLRVIHDPCVESYHPSTEFDKLALLEIQSYDAILNICVTKLENLMAGNDPERLKNKIFLHDDVEALWSSEFATKYHQLPKNLDGIRRNMGFFLNWIKTQTQPTAFPLNVFLRPRCLFHAALKAFAKSQRVPYDQFQLSFEIRSSVPETPEPDRIYLTSIALNSKPIVLSCLPKKENASTTMFSLPLYSVWGNRPSDFLVYTIPVKVVDPDGAEFRIVI